MKKKRVTEEQIIGILREQEAGAMVANLARKNAVSEATLYNCKAKFGGRTFRTRKRLKALEDENAKLKKLLADQLLEASALSELLEKMVGPAVKREAVAHLRAVIGLSEHRACHIVAICTEGVTLIISSLKSNEDPAKMAPDTRFSANVIGVMRFFTGPNACIAFARPQS